jgi:hypothetical protein
MGTTTLQPCRRKLPPPCNITVADRTQQQGHTRPKLARPGPNCPHKSLPCTLHQASWAPLWICKNNGLGHLQWPGAFRPQIASDLVCLGRGPNIERALSSLLDSLGGDCPQQPDAFVFCISLNVSPTAHTYVSGHFGLLVGIQLCGL